MNQSRKKLTIYIAIAVLLQAAIVAAKEKPAAPAWVTPTLSGKAEVQSVTAPELLKPPGALPDGIAIAKTAPTIDFAYFPGQDYAGKPWSAWGNSVCHDGKYYASIGDHLGPTGNAFIYEFDPQAKEFRQLLNLKELLKIPTGDYQPGKIHSSLGFGKDGKIYCGTHRGATNATSPEFHYQGDWLIATDPATSQAEIVCQAPVGLASVPTGIVDGDRMVFHGSTQAADRNDKSVEYFAYDLAKRKLLARIKNGPDRLIMLSSSTGRVYYTPHGSEKLVRFDAQAESQPVELDLPLSARAATTESKSGVIFAVSTPGDGEPQICALHVDGDKLEELGPATVGGEKYITAIELDPTGRYLYYVPGAHGGGYRDGSPIVQFDVVTRQRKILAFLHPFFEDKFGVAPVGTYSVALSEQGDALYVTWNARRVNTKPWDTCLLTVIHIPESERAAQ